MQIDRHLAHAQSEAGAPLVFVHIPKTAGTTLNAIIAHRYASGEIHEIMMRGMSLIVSGEMTRARPLVSRSKLRRLQAALERGLRVINGHFDMSLAPLLPAGAQYVTIVRDPIDRAVSHYYHYRRLTTDPVHPLALRSTLTQWVGASGLAEMDNGQTRRLAGEMGLPVGAVSSHTLDRAKANLAQRFAVVGLTERFEEFQVLLHRKFNWPYLRYPTRNVGNKRPARTEMSAEALRVIEKCNRYDLELYRFAAELFGQATGKVDMKRELSLLRAAPEYVAPDRSPSAHSAAAATHPLSKLNFGYLLTQLIAPRSASE